MYENRGYACGPAGQHRGALCRPPPFPSLRSHIYKFIQTHLPRFHEVIGGGSSRHGRRILVTASCLGKEGEREESLCLCGKLPAWKGRKERGRRLELGCCCVTLTNPFCQNVERPARGRGKQERTKNAGSYSGHAHKCSTLFPAKSCFWHRKNFLLQRARHFPLVTCPCFSAPHFFHTVGFHGLQ